MFNIDSIKGFNKLTKDQQFFVLNFLKFATILYNEGEKSLIDINKIQNENASELLKEIANIMLKFNIDNNVMNMTLLEKRAAINNIDEKINNLFHNEYNQESEIVKNTLVDQGKKKYSTNNYLLNLGIDFKIKSISDKKLNQILERTIEGKNYSERIWDNKNKIAKQLKVKIRDFLNGSINCNDIEKVINERFEVDKSDSKRLVRNEITRVQNQVNEEFFKDNDGEYLLYSATLDTHTCDICKDYDGKVYKVNEDRPQLPIHTNDRCTYILLPDKDYRPSKRINNITKEEINYTTYQEWENNLKKEKESAIIKDVIESIKDGRQPLKIEVGKQGKHILGHNNYIEGRSYLKINLEEAQELINKYAGTGKLVIDSKGNWRKQEIIKTDRAIGVNVSDIDGSERETNSFKIHYSKKGTHIVPK